MSLDPIEKGEMKPEYDFASMQRGMQGKYFRELQAGYRVTVHKEDGSTEEREYRPNENAVILEPDVQRYFPDSQAVNHALRGLIELIPEQ